MSKRPTDGLEPAAKKRGSSRQLTKDDPSDEEEEDRGLLETASEDVLKKRRIVRARRGTGAPPSTPTGGPQKAATPANPFAGISLFGSTGTTAQITAQPVPAEGSVAVAGQPVSSVVTQPIQESVHDDSQAAIEASPAKQAAEAPENGKGPDAPSAVPATQEGGVGQEALDEQEQDQQTSTSTEVKSNEAAAPTFASLAASSAPFATVGTTKAFGFGTLTNGNTTSNGTQEGGVSQAKPFSFGTSAPAFSFQPQEGGFPAVPSIFGSSSQAGAGDQSTPEADNTKPALATLPPELETKTGEEDEAVLWSGEGSLYEFDAAKAWKERGKGDLKINRAPGRPARFVMRQRGQHRLLMNANLWPQMKVTQMDGGKGVTFPVINDASKPEGGGEPQLQTFAFRLKAANQLGTFVEAIETNKQLLKGA